jgi:carboxylate-amine ligase
LNLPFYDDEEFAKLHAAIRLILPLLPALCASSPILDGKLSGQLDTRLMYYKSNQAKIPCITGRVIPEAVFSKRNYFNTIYNKIQADISPYDPDQILNPIWVNSRGAIPRFDRGSIEIRIMDIQECASADLALVSLVIETIKLFVQGSLIDHEDQMKWKTDTLAPLFEKVVEKGPDVIIDNADYLNVFRFPGRRASVGELWSFILQLNIDSGNAIKRWKPEIDVILKQGNLSQRIINALNGDYSRDNIISVYKKLSTCLEQNKMFLV